MSEVTTVPTVAVSVPILVQQMTDCDRAYTNGVCATEDESILTEVVVGDNLELCSEYLYYNIYDNTC